MEKMMHDGDAYRCCAGTQMWLFVPLDGRSSSIGVCAPPLTNLRVPLQKGSLRCHALSLEALPKG